MKMDKTDTEASGEPCEDIGDGKNKKWQAPKDHGYSWVILLGAFFDFFLVMGGYRAFGVVFVELKYQYPDKNEEDFTILPMVAVFAGYCLAPLITGLTTRVSCRTLNIIGGITGCLQYLCGAFAPNYTVLAGTFSTFAALTVPLVYVAPIISVGQYFDKRRAMANGIAMAGSSLGNLAFPLIFRLVFENMGFRNGLIIVAGIMLNACWCGALLRPLSFYKKPTKLSTKAPPANKIYKPSHNNAHQNGRLALIQKEDIKSKSLEVLTMLPETSMRQRADTIGTTDKSDKQKTKLNDIRIKGIEELAYISSASIAEGIEMEKKLALNTESNDKPKSCLQILKDFWYMPSSTGVRQPLIDFSLITNLPFVALCFSVFCSSSCYLVFIMAVTAHIDDLGYTQDEGATTVAIMGIADLFGRLVLVFLVELKPFSKYKMYAFSVYIAISGVFALCVSLSNSLVTITIMASLFKMFCGTMYPLIPVLLVETLGLQKLASSLGLILLAQALSSLMFTTAGKLRIETGTWLPVFYVITGLAFVSAAVAAMLPLVKKCRSKDKPPQQQPAESVLLQEGADVADTTREA